MEELKRDIARLYYETNCVRFGAFELSVHRDNPSLPKSPWKVRLPDTILPGTPAARLVGLIGRGFYLLSEDRKKPIRPRYIAGLPNGSLPLARAYAKQYVGSPDNVLTFEKLQLPNGTTKFIGPHGNPLVPGREVVTVDDHISGGRNNRLFIDTVRSLGGIVNHTLVVLDREQGARANLGSEEVNVELYSLLTATELLHYGVDLGRITCSQMEEVQAYIRENQFA